MDSFRKDSVVSVVLAVHSMVSTTLLQVLQGHLCFCCAALSLLYNCVNVERLLQ